MHVHGVLWCSGRSPTRSSPRQRSGKQAEVKQEPMSPLVTSKGAKDVAADKPATTEKGAKEWKRLGRLVAEAARVPLPDEEDPELCDF